LFEVRVLCVVVCGNLEQLVISTPLDVYVLHLSGLSSQGLFM